MGSRRQKRCIKCCRSGIRREGRRHEPASSENSEAYKVLSCRQTSVLAAGADVEQHDVLLEHVPITRLLWITPFLRCTCLIKLDTYVVIAQIIQRSPCVLEPVLGAPPPCC